MAVAFSVGPAGPGELEPALALMFQHVPEGEAAVRVANALRLAAAKELSPDGILVARAPAGVLASLVCLPVPGASGLFWPPQAVTHPDRYALEDALVRHALAWLRRQGVKLVQTLLAPGEDFLGDPLLRNGFAHITDLLYLRHDLDLPLALLFARDRLRYLPYAPEHETLFQQVLQRTYEQTSDCPEINGVRTLAETLEGHRAQGAYRPERWRVALDDRGTPVGVLLLTHVPEWDGLDVTYVGVVPEARGRGLGRELTGKALREARDAGSAQLTLAVDLRNDPARNLYRSLGFEVYDRRGVYLATLADARF